MTLPSLWIQAIYGAIILGLLMVARISGSVAASSTLRAVMSVISSRRLSRAFCCAASCCTDAADGGCCVPSCPGTCAGAREPCIPPWRKGRARRFWGRASNSGSVFLCTFIRPVGRLVV